MTSSFSSSKLPILKRSEVIVHKKLGSGGFCSVFSLRKFVFQTTRNENSNTNIRLLQKQFQDYETQYFSNIVVVPGGTLHSSDTKMEENWMNTTSPKPPRVAIKKIKDSLTQKDPNTDLRYKTGLQDLIFEIQILEILQHPNIIGIYAMGYDDDKDDDDENSMSTTEFQPTFCIIDQLRSTLRNRIHKWKDDWNTASLQGILFQTKKHPSSIPKNQIWLERLVVLLKIADAIKYMHQQGIVHRDINPDNIGFTDDNVVKIFDFGLAKRLVIGGKEEEDTHSKRMMNDPTQEHQDQKPDSSMKEEDELWQLTSKTGTLRYMSPEVGLSMPYGFKVDVYSLGIVMHEILSLTKPFLHVKPSVFQEQVMQGGLRPSLDESWPKCIRELVAEMWSSDIGRRPKSSVVVHRLEQILRGKDEDLYPEYYSWTRKLGSTFESLAEDLKSVGGFHINSKGSK